jgi:hypothetical protein
MRRLGKLFTIEVLIFFFTFWWSAYMALKAILIRCATVTSSARRFCY